MMSTFYPAICTLILVLQNKYIADSTSWSPGTYALLKPRSGCPTGWETEGWINHNTGYNNDKSNTLHMQGEVNNNNILEHFCIKRIQESLEYRSWPTGQYCIYGKRKRQSNGYVRIYETITWDNAHKNVWPFVSVYSNRYFQLYFQCSTTGNKKTPISLPITEPFYLLPYGSHDCQQVEWMVATSEWIKYHTRNYDGYSYYQKYGTVPYSELGRNQWNTGITMYYCYYESCNYTLNDTSGVFQSPGFPGKYPDGQLCSWRIMVPDNHTLVVNFTQFSLYEYDKDCLQLYEYDSRRFRPKQSFFGYDSPFTITATSHLIFVFRSDEENNSIGFRANYMAFKTLERATTASTKPTTTTTHPTTITQTTTKLKTTQPLTTKHLSTKPTTITEARTLPTTENVHSTNETLHFTSIPNKNNSHNKSFIYPSKKTSYCDETWRIVVMVIPLAIFILIVLVIIDIFCRYRHKKALKSGPAVLSADDGMAINPTYERGNIIIGQSADTGTNETTAADQLQSRDEPPKYEDIDYTQLNVNPISRRATKRQECHELQPVGNDTSSVFYHVLEPPKTESIPPQSHVSEPADNGTSEVFYHTLEPPTDLSSLTYQNLSELNHCTLNPIYESAENSPCTACSSE